MSRTERMTLWASPTPKDAVSALLAAHESPRVNQQPGSRRPGRHRRNAMTTPVQPIEPSIDPPVHRAVQRQQARRDETGAASAEYAVVTAAGVGIGGIL